MNRSRDIRSRRILAFELAMLFGAIVTTMLLPAYGQQEDPSDLVRPVGCKHVNQPRTTHGGHSLLAGASGD